jgi:MoaA/NifB/PqqE/SkfB family radical SAM enzyme
VVVAAARARGMGVNITTNGLLVDRRWNELITSGVSSLSMSLDGLEETHDTLRGQKGAFRKTMAALVRVLGAGIPCSVYFTVTRTNVGELVSVWRQVRAMGAGFDFWPVNDAPDLALRTAEEKATFLAAVAEIGAADPEVASRKAYYAEGLDYHGGKNPSVRCLGLIDQYGVKYDGTFLPCCVWGGEGLALGNVFETPLRTLWTSPEVQEFRERMFHKGCDAGCYNHSLYEFSASTGLPFRVSAPG